MTEPPPATDAGPTGAPATPAAPAGQPAGGAARPVRTRFAPSPSGDLHVGNVRTALYSWAYARHCGGAFVVRIEDTDRNTATAAAIRGIGETLSWLGLSWDEGPGVGGPYGPYLQSERLTLHQDWAHRFVAAGHAYLCYCTAEELDAERERQRAAGRPPGYSGRCRTLTAAQRAAFEAEGRRPAVRFAMPPGQTVVHDLVRGDIVFDHEHIPDFVILRANGQPLYQLAVSVDDALMRITHIVRGDDLLASTPRQIAIYRAMGVSEQEIPAFAHLPYVLDPAGRPLSKRYGSASIGWYRDRGYLPEAVVNYLALLGWSPGGDREELSLFQIAELFTLDRVGANPARLDLKKLDAINGDKIRALEPADFVARLLPFCERAGLVATPPTPEQADLVARAAPLVQERSPHLTEAAALLAFLFVAEDAFAPDPESAARALTPAAAPLLAAAVDALSELPEWTHGPIEDALRRELVERLGAKPRVAFAPVRVAVTGRRVSPPLFESMELLGRERSLRRLRSAERVCRAAAGADGADAR